MNGLIPQEDRPASTLVIHEDGDREYVRLVERYDENQVGIEVPGTSAYYHGEGGEALTREQLGPYFPNNKMSRFEKAAQKQGDPGRPLQRPVDYRDVTLTRIREIRAHGEVWVVGSPVIEFPAPEGIEIPAPAATVRS
jgi:hypothetical protein